MSLSASAAAGAAVPVERRRWLGLRVGSRATPLALISLAALFALCHPYEGLVGDSTVYVGRILADHDPAGLGRDLLFANDGQSNFSLFRILAGPLVLALGPSLAAAIVAAAGSLCWLAGLVALAHGLARGRTAWAIVILVTVLPTGYGDTGHFAFAEPSAVPRPFAEAAVISAFAAILAGRWRLALASLAAAAALHPIMAMPGIGVAGMLWLWQLAPARRRIALAFLVALVGVSVLAGLAGVPLLARMGRVVDAEWFGMIASRGPHLFPTLWTSSALSPLMAATGTLMVAARLVTPPRGRLFLAVVIVGGAGLAASVVLSDTLHLMLFVQLQMWRATWLVAVLGGCALAACADALWRRDDVGRLALALLALAWAIPLSPLFTAVLVGAALLLEFGTLKDRLPLGGRVIGWLYALAGLAIMIWVLGGVAGYLAFLRALPSGDAPRLADPVRNGLQTVPLAVAAAVWLLGPRLPARWAVPSLALVAFALGLAAVALWDQRPAAARVLEHAAPPGFAAPAGDPPSDVLWLDGMGEAWFSLRRPQYLSAQQAVSMVFSRALAMEWRHRAQLLVDAGLARRSILRPFTTPADGDRLRVTPDALARFCGRVDAPGAIVLPIEKGTLAPPVAGLSLWPLRTPLFAYEGHVSAEEWHEITALAAIPCRRSFP